MTRHDLDEHLISQWRDMWSSQPRATPNAEPDRFLAVCKSLGVTPELLEIRDNQGRAGLIVGRRERIRITRRLGYLAIRLPPLESLVIVYGGVLGSASPDAVADRILTVLSDPTGVDHVVFNKLEHNSELFNTLLDLRYTIQHKIEPHWVIDLPDGYEALMSNHSSKHRSNLRRLDRRLFEGDSHIIFNEYCSPDSVLRFSAAARDLLSQTYQSGIGVGSLPPDLWTSVLACESAKNRLFCFSLEDSSGMLAFQAGAIYGKTYYCEGTSYLPSYASMRPGTVLLHRVLKRLGDLGVQVVDFGFGDAEYKQTYGTRSWTEATLHVYGSGLRSKMCFMLDIFVLKSDWLCKRTMSPLLVQRIKRWWRNRLTPKGP